MKARFVQVYLASAGVILAVTALGKAIPVPNLYLCIEQPILGPLQLGLTNQILLWISSALEFGIFGLICFARPRWLPCFVCGLWGALCLLVRLVFLGTAVAGSCHCLGWFERMVPLPTEVVNTILAIFAAWLAVGGFVSFRQAWHNTGPNLPGQASAA